MTRHRRYLIIGLMYILRLVNSVFLKTFSNPYLARWRSNVTAFTRMLPSMSNWRYLAQACSISGLLIEEGSIIGMLCCFSLLRYSR